MAGLCYIALGSNLGHRAWHLGQAVLHLRQLEGLTIQRTSSLYSTAAQYVADQPSFLNAVVEVRLSDGRLANLPELMADLKGIEASLGREPGERRGPRVVDLDIVAVGETAHRSHEPPYPLEIPHACMHERDFVLVPMAELAPDWRHPTREGRPSIQEMIQALRTSLEQEAMAPAGAALETWPVQVISASGGPAGRPSSKVWQRGERTLIMGILNTTPDSFSDGGDFIDPTVATEHAAAMVEAGADIIDIGGESTRPGSADVSVEEEIRRVVPVIQAIRERGLDITISVDTRKSSVAKAAVESGADWINDVSGGEFDTEMLPTAAALAVPIVLMHMRGTPATMQNLTQYDDVVKEVGDHLAVRRAAALQLGIPAWNVLLDPGVGFAKKGAQNLELLRRCRELVERVQPTPVLIGASRKRFIGDILGEPEAKHRTFGNAAATSAAIVGRADVVRVHEVKEMVQTAKVCDYIYRDGLAAKL